IASLEQQLAVRITTRSRKSSKKKALSRLFSWTAATDTRTVQPSAGEPRPPCKRPIRRGRNACFDSSSRAGSLSCRRACAFCGPSRFIENRRDSLHRQDLLVTPGNGRMIASMTPRTGWALLWFAFPFVVTACSAACLLKAADPASGVTPAADPPAVLPPPIAGRAAISPAAPIIPGETVAAFQDGNHEAARGALVKSNCGKTPRTLMNGPTSVIFKASPGDWRATPMRHEQLTEPPPPRTRPAAG